MKNNSVYRCLRCKRTYDEKIMFIQHLNDEVPCDKYCGKCGQYLPSRSSYQDHVQEPCEPIPIPMDVNNSANLRKNNIKK